MKKTFFMLTLTFCLFSFKLFSSNQIADPVFTGNIHFQYNVAYAGYFSENDKALADTLKESRGYRGFTFNYGLSQLLDLIVGYQKSSAGFGLKFSPDFKIPFRFGVKTDLYTNISNILVYPIIGGIISYHINDNVTLTTGYESFLHFQEKITNNLFFTLDIERGEVFKNKVSDFFINIFIPKSFQIDVEYPFSDRAKKLYIGFSIRHEFELNSPEDKI